MKRTWMTAKYINNLLGALLVVMIVQYAVLTCLVRPGQLVFKLMQIFCYLLLTSTLFRGFIERSRLAWLIAQMMLIALFASSLLFTCISAILSLSIKSFWALAAVALFTAVVNGIQLGFLFSLPVCNYYCPSDKEGQ